MGWKKQYIKDLLQGIVNRPPHDPEIIVWSPKKEYHSWNIKKLLGIGAAIGVSTVIAGYAMFADTIHKIQGKYHPNSNITVNKPIEPIKSEKFIEPEMPKTQFASFTSDVTPNNVEKVVPNMELSKKYTAKSKTTFFLDNIIHAEDLQEAGTTLPNSNLLEYSDNGVRVPASNFSIRVDGQDYYPNSNLFIELPDDVMNKEVRLTTFNPEKIDQDMGKYIASFPTTIVDNRTPDHGLAKIDAEGLFSKPDVVPSGLLASIDGAVAPVSQPLFDLDTIVEDGLDNFSPPKTESIDTISSVYGNSSSFYKALDLTKDQMYDSLLKELENEKKIGIVNHLMLNSDGYVRSDSNIVKQLGYGVNGQKTFTERAIELKKKFYSNKKIAKTMREETKQYFENDEGWNINHKQVSDSLKSANWVSEKEYKKNKAFYHSQSNGFTVYKNSSIISLGSQNK